MLESELIPGLKKVLKLGLAVERSLPQGARTLRNSSCVVRAPRVSSDNRSVVESEENSRLAAYCSS